MNASTTHADGDRRRKALVFIDYDMLVRHFVLSGAFAELEKRFHVRYVFHADSTSPKQALTAPSILPLSREPYPPE